MDHYVRIPKVNNILGSARNQRQLFLIFEDFLVNVRLIATICCLAMIGSGLAGCAGSPTRDTGLAPTDVPESQDLERLPQLLLPGAIRSEVKSFAMGAARSKGWSIGQSSDNRLVVHRPIDANSLANFTPNVPSSAVGPGSLLEVTSFFIEQSGGVKVATKADLVTPIPGERVPARFDYTETFRDSLTQSLASLKQSWSDNRGRIARATPPAAGWKDAWDTAPSKTGSDRVASVTSDQTALETDLAETIPAPPALPARPQTQTKPLPPIETEPPVRNLSRNQSPQPGEWIAEKPAPIRPAPEPRHLSAGGAPVVDGTMNVPSNSLSTRTPATKTPVAASDTLPRRENMMTLPVTRSPVAGSVSWAAYAEQYARERGCQVEGLGTELIESRTDGEVHKVPCVGSDSFLVKCQNGICKGLL